MRWGRAMVVPVMLAALAAPVAAGAATQAATQPAANGGSALSLSASRVQETATGTARTLDVPGGYVVAHSFGEISMVRADGRTAWQRDTQSLYRDWDVTWQHPGFTESPQLAWGGNPVDPLEFTGAGTGLVNDVNPVAAGDLDGHLDVAVAEAVGANMTSESFCAFCTWPFDVPGSSLHVGTFVTVLDGRTGRMVYHELVPGYVTQLAIAGGRLIVGGETGDPQQLNPMGAWGSVTTVRALTLTASGARQAWQYSTGAPWGRLLDIATTGGPRPGIALAWSDTPLGLGVPGPPDGHVLLLDAVTGAIRWQVRTPGYPVLTGADDQRGELAVVQLTDPTQSVGYTLTGLRYGDGSVAVTAQRPGALPVSLAVGGGRGDGGWAVGAVDATTRNGYYIPAQGRVTLTDPASGRELWSAVLPQTSYGTPVPGGLALTRGLVIAGAWLGSVAPTAAAPLQREDGITAFDYRTGTAVWNQAGDPGDPLSLSVVSRDAGVVRAVNSHQDVETYAADGSPTVSTAAGPGDFISAATASVASPDSTDLVAGNEDGDVYALDGRALSAGTRRVLWRAHLPGPVQHITRTSLDGREVLVVAATSAVGVLDARTGWPLRLIATPGTYAYTATVISAAGTPAVVVPGASLTAYALATGARLWSYPAPPGASFSDAGYADGVVAAEYSNAASGYPGYQPATEMAAVGLSAATGEQLWTRAADRSVVQRGQLWNGTIASPDIAGAGGDGVAFAWQDSNGDGQVDVRNIATGTLLYSDTSQSLAALTQFLAVPSLGLVGVSQTGSALITPSGAEGSYYPVGVSGALARSSSGDTALLVADAGVNAFGTDIFTTSSPAVLASESTYDTGSLISGDFAGNGTRQAVATPADWLAYQVVNAETGYHVMPNLVTVQRGMAVLTLTDSGASSAQGPAAKPSSGSAPSVRYPVPALPKAGPAKPASESAGTLPVGQVGSVPPSPEPARSGTARPGTTPVTARHTLNSASSAVPPGYSPAQIRGYLGLTGDGSGQTVAIVDAYNDPNITADAETFSEQYGLPGVCGAGGTAGDCFTLRVAQQSASAGTDPGWALETSLDVEWAHAIAPRATIELTEASEASFASLFRGVAAAAAAGPAAVSMSWGISGEFSDETYYDHFCAVTSTVCVVSAGDYGHPGSYPAYNPAVIAIGGTTLTLGADGSVSSELAWSGSGGGQSWVEPEPAYQAKVQSSGEREMPDVSFDADPSTGVAIYDSVPYAGQAGWWVIGGTSLGAPSVSAMLADADQLRAATGEPPLTAAGFAAQRAIYSLPSSVIAPVTSGPENGICPAGCTPGPGYDEITGLGSPRAGIDAALAG